MRKFKKRVKRGERRSNLSKASFNQPAMSLRTRYDGRNIAPREIIDAAYSLCGPEVWREAMKIDKFLGWERVAESVIDSLSPMTRGRWYCSRMKYALFTQNGSSREKQMLAATSSAPNPHGGVRKCTVI